MPRLAQRIRKPVVFFAAVFTAALIAEFLILEGFAGISLPSDRDSATSSYEIREKGKELHYITRNKRFSIVDVWSKHGTAVDAIVLRESFVMDRQEGMEGANSTVRVEALGEKVIRWSFEEPGEQGAAMNQMYEVTKFGCCDSPNTYTYFSLRDGKKLRTTHSKLTPDEFAALEKPLYE